MDEEEDEDEAKEDDEDKDEEDEDEMDEKERRLFVPASPVLILHNRKVGVHQRVPRLGHLQRGGLAVGETVILLTPPLPLVGVSIVMERGCQQNDSLADGSGGPCG